MVSTRVEGIDPATGPSSEACCRLFHNFRSEHDLAHYLQFSSMPQPDRQRQNGDPYSWRDSQSPRSSTVTPLRFRPIGNGKATRETGFGPLVTTLPKLASSGERQPQTSWRGLSFTNRWSLEPLTEWTAAASFVKYSSRAGTSHTSSASIGNLHSCKEERR